MENSNRTMCSGNCQACNFQQRVYCSAYMARANYSMMEGIMQRIDALQERMNAIHSDGNLISPLKEEKESTTMASGAENRLPKESNFS